MTAVFSWCIGSNRLPATRNINSPGRKFRGEADKHTESLWGRHGAKRMSYPAEYKYTKEHEWIKPDGTIGITNYAQESLGDIVFVDLPKVGAELTVGKTFGSVESVKAVSDLYAPASGTVTEVNADLATSPEKINKDAHGSWMVKIKLKDPGELNALLSATDYEKFIAEEGGS
jgi:glycine cleavage system H protein